MFSQAPLIPRGHVQKFHREASLVTPHNLRPSDSNLTYMHNGESKTKAGIIRSRLTPNSRCEYQPHRVGFSFVQIMLQGPFGCIGQSPFQCVFNDNLDRCIVSMSR